MKITITKPGLRAALATERLLDYGNWAEGASTVGECRVCAIGAVLRRHVRPETTTGDFNAWVYAGVMRGKHHYGPLWHELLGKSADDDTEAGMRERVLARTRRACAERVRLDHLSYLYEALVMIYARRRPLVDRDAAVDYARTLTLEFVDALPDTLAIPVDVPDPYYAPPPEPPHG